MAQPVPTNMPVGPDTLITVKVIIDGTNRRFKLALRDLGANVLPHKLRLLLSLPPETEVIFDRFSDSAGSYVTLDSTNPAIYKQLYRAAKAKLKLRLRATILENTASTTTTAHNMPTDVLSHNTLEMRSSASQSEPRQSFLDTVLSPTAPNPVPFRTFPASRPLDPSSSVAAPLQSSKISIEASPLKLVVPECLGRAAMPSHCSIYGNIISIDCNECHKSIPNEHFHCSTCEGGDFDLCQACVDQGITCYDEDHWLIKRFIQDGTIVPSQTERLAPRSQVPHSLPTKPSAETVPAAAKSAKHMETRVCNSCIENFTEDVLVTCQDCPDYDLCFSCFQTGEHGHHPAHTFQPVDECQFIRLPLVDLLQAGRGVTHDAVCDGCDKHIIGIRHKCLNCPDWDYCSSCILSAEHIHPGHRFAPLFEPLNNSLPRGLVHHGIHCDGPLCVGRRPKSYIRGIRYKCAVCHDMDFCANCEALPLEHHNKTHPLIKFKTPVRNVSITTLGEDDSGHKMPPMGDRVLRARNASTETAAPAPSANAATQVQTVAEVKPAEAAVPLTSEVEKHKAVPVELQAWFESDSTPDGTRVGPNHFIRQTWTLRNPGPQAWPVGCAVYFIGGDDMRNLDMKHPSSVSTLSEANRSSVLQHSLGSGQTAEFTVTLKSPPRECRVISYWRLKTPDGVPFGHKLWVDVTVVASPAESSSAPHTPTSPDFPLKAEVSEPTSTGDGVKSESSSTMIFPKLEKESPAASMHEVAEIPAEPTIKTEHHELLEDIESLELDEDETEEGFLTDEEYDILDASDEDFLMEAHKAATKQ